MTEPLESPRIFYIDLTLGAWRPHEAARQLAAALGIALDHPTDRGDVTKATTGDPIVLYAHAAASKVAKTLPDGAIVAVLAPQFGFAFRRENEWFLLFLKRCGLSVSLVGGEPATTVVGRPIFEPRRAVKAPGIGESETQLNEEQLRILRFFPGLLSRKIAATAGVTIGNAFLIPVGRDHLLIPPAYRDTDPSKAALEFDALMDFGSEDEGLTALAETYCTAHFADSAGVAAMSAAAADAGGLDLARDLAIRARRVARTPEDMAVGDLHVLEACHRSGHFADAQMVSSPSRQASESVRTRLARLRLEAAIANDDEAAVRSGIRPLETLLFAGETLPDEDLLLLNDAMAVLVRSGDAERARTLDVAIRKQIERFANANRTIAFRAAMSRARLCSRMGEDESARNALDQALATSAGTRDLSEIIEMNALLAGQETDQTSAAARSAWLRTGLSWLAYDPPEALSADAAGAILGDREISRASLDLDLCEVLVDRLATAWPDIEVPAGIDYWPVRVASERDHPSRLFGAPGAAVLWMTSADRPPIYIRPRIHLAKMVRAILGTLCPAMLDLDEGVLLVDCNLGMDIPATREAALSVALRTNIEDAVFEFETIVLDPANRARIVGQIMVRLSPGVSSAETRDEAVHVRFLRGAEVTINGRAAEALAPLLDTQQMPIGALAVLLGETVLNAERLYRSLEALGVLRMDVGTPADKVHQDEVAASDSTTLNPSTEDTNP